MTTPPAPRLPQRPKAALVSALLVLSGASGLVYEVVWSRSLQLVFGVSTFAITTVVAAYMAGLALGSGLVGRLADRWTPAGAVAAYGAIEIAIGVFAFLFAPLLETVTLVYRAIAPAAPAGLETAVQFALTFGLLMIPTVLMGVTLPFVSRVFAARSGRVGRGFGWAYALNTAGAVAGVVLAAFVLLPELGARRSLFLFGAVNLLVGTAAIAAARAAEGPWRARVAPTGSPATVARPARTRRRALVVAAVTGCVALGCEIAWIRGFASLMLSTTYTFALVLIVYLIGLAIGSAIGARLPGSRALLGWVFVVLGASCLSQILLYDFCHRSLWRAVAAPDRSFESLLLRQALLVTIVVLPLTLCSGAALPRIVSWYSKGIASTGRDVGAVYVANTAGAVAGTVLAGFVLLPALGAFDTCRVLAVLALCGVVVIGHVRSFAFAGALAISALLWIEDPGPKQRSMSPIFLGTRGNPLDRGDFERRAPYEMLDLRFGRTADVAVTTAVGSGQRALWINGMTNASTYSDLQTQYALSVVPYLYAPRVADCLHVGLGSGITAGVWATLPGTRRVRVVELEERLWESMRAFDPYHFSLHERDNVEFVAGDARSWLELADGISLDVIVSEPSQLWAKGVGNLFTREFFAIVRRALAPDGIFVTWMMAYEIPDEVWAIGAATLLEAFERVACFASPSYPGDVFFVCSGAPLRFQRERWEQLQGLEGTAAWIPRALELEQPDDLAMFYLGRGTDLKPRVLRVLARAGTPDLRNTDDHPVLEHLYPRWIGSRTTVQLIGELYRARFDPEERRFAMPPDLAGVEPRERVRWVLSGQSRTDALPDLTGVAGFDELTDERLTGLSEQQRGWAFAAAVRARRDELAAKIVGSLDAVLRDEPYLGVAVGELADRLQSTLDPAFVARLGEAGPRSPKALVLALLAAHWRRFESALDTAAAARYVRTFLAGFPAERLLTTNPPARSFELLRRAALASNESEAVLDYFQAIDALLSWRYSTAGLERIQLLVDLGRRDEARELLRAYDGWTFAGNERLNELRAVLSR